jgi:hypothetical protein
MSAYGKDFIRFSFKANVWYSIFYVFNGNRFDHQNIGIVTITDANREAPFVGVVRVF